MTSRILILTVFIFALVSGSIAQDSLQVTQDSSKSKKTSFLSLNSVYVEAGYEYGLLPFLGDSTAPNQNFRTFGNVGVQIKSLPVNIGFLYNSNQANIGINNYFNVSFDAQLYKQQQLEKLYKKRQVFDDSLLQVGKSKDLLTKKLKYLELIEQNKIAFPIDSGMFADKWGQLPGFNWMDSLNNLPGVSSYTLEDLPIPYDQKELLLNKILAYKTGILQNMEIKDSTMESLEKYLNMNPDSIVQNKAYSFVPGMSKFQKIVGTINKFDIGLCYPDYSKYLISQIPLRGINLEMSTGKFFGAFSHGTVQPNIFFSNNLIGNTLNSAQNAFNFFDFTNTDLGRKVTSVKLGLGQKNDNHIHAGVLYGFGDLSYTDTLNNGLEKNAVFEIDGMIRGKWWEAQVIYGRSQLQTMQIGEQAQTSLFQELMSFKDRSNALFAQVGTQISKTSTELELYGRYVEPLFESFGVGFMRSDNLRFQVKVSQKLGKKGKISAFYRRENDNVLQWYDFQNVISSWGLSGTYRPTKSWRFRADLRPLTFNSELADSTFGSQSYIATGIASFQKRHKKTRILSNTMFSFYQFSQNDISQTYLTAGNQTQIIINSKLNLDISYNYFQTSDTSTIPASNLFSLGAGYTMAKLKIHGNLKLAAGEQSTELGGGFDLSYKLLKYLTIKTTIEKVVAGNFYTQYYLENLQKFPYYCYGRIVILF